MQMIFFWVVYFSRAQCQLRLPTFTGWIKQTAYQINLIRIYLLTRMGICGLVVAMA